MSKLVAEEVEGNIWKWM